MVKVRYDERMEKHSVAIGDLYDVMQGAYLKKRASEVGTAEMVIRIQNLTALELTGEFAVEALTDEKIDRFRVRAGQIVVALRGAPLKASVVGPLHAGGVISSNFAVLSAKEAGGLDPFFLVGILRSAVFNQVIIPRYAGGMLSSLSVSQLKKLEIPRVPLVQQQQWGQVFRALEQYQQAVHTLLRDREVQVEAYVGQLLQGGM